MKTRRRIILVWGSKHLWKGFYRTSWMFAKSPREHLLSMPRNIDSFSNLDKLINVKTYRYPYHQKNEIKRQVYELLEIRHIHYSQNVFSNPMILVKKKKNEQRMCVHWALPKQPFLTNFQYQLSRSSQTNYTVQGISQNWT